MKTAALDTRFDTPFDASRGAELLPGLNLLRAAEAEPVCWRSEGFAEDLSDSMPDQPAAPSRKPLLRRALAAVLRR